MLNSNKCKSSANSEETRASKKLAKKAEEFKLLEDYIMNEEFNSLSDPEDKLKAIR